MSMWTAIVIIVTLGIISEMYRARLKTASEKGDHATKQLEERMTHIEKRMANLEAIILERKDEERWNALKD